VQGIPCRPSFRVLTDEQLDRIHERSLSILQRTGIRFDSEDARKRLVAAGASEHPTKRDVMTFPPEIVEEAVRKVPRNPTFFARNPSWDVTYDGEHIFPYGGGGDPKMIDLTTGEIRPSTIDDVQKAVRLGDALQNNFLASTLVVPNDVPAGILPLKTLEAAIVNSSKTVSEVAHNKQTVDYMMKMCAHVSGGTEEFRKRPFLNISRSPSSPLTYARGVCDVLIRCAELGIPFTVVPCPICGATGPMSIGGSLAQQNAETLGGLVLMQSIEPGLPTVYSGRVCFMDPRTGRDLWGTPEEAIASVAMVQLSKKYNMVADACGMTSDVPRWDMQMGLERMMTILLPALAGADSISGIGSGWEGASSLEMMVIDNEILNDVARVLRGIQIDEPRFAMDVIDKVGHMGNFLAQRHTLEYLRKDEVRVSGLWDKRTTERGNREGSRPIQEVARERARKLLAEHQPEPIDRDVAESIRNVVREASKTLL